MSKQLQHMVTQQPTAATRSTLQTVVMAFAILYWLSPIDALPLLPFDDVAVMVMSYLFYSKNDAGNVEGGDQ